MNHAPESGLDIAAVVCTIGERVCLEKAVASLAAQSLDSRRYEILVVVNRDDEELRRRLRVALDALTAGTGVRLRVTAEPTPGLSYARNRGFRETSARIVAYIDDDAQADPDWLANILEGFDRDPKIASVGGDILPLWEVEPPAWIKPPLHPYFSCRGFGASERYLGKGEYFFGANMAFRRDLLLDCGGFPLNLGRRGESLLSNEEWPVFNAIDSRDLRKLASPRVKVLHLVPAARMTSRFFIRRLWWQGVSNTIYHLECEGRSRPWVARQALADFKRYYGALPRLLRLGHATGRLALFNLARWFGIAFALISHAPQELPRGAKPTRKH